MGMEFIRTDKLKEIQTVFRDRVKKPKKSWLEALEVMLQGAEVPRQARGVLDAFGRLVQRERRQEKLYAATWMWLRPDEPRMKASDLIRIQATLGLDDMRQEEFLHRIREESDEIARSVRDLSRYVRTRIVDLEYLQVRNPWVARPLRGSAEPIQRLVINAAHRLDSQPMEARTQARVAGASALAACAVAAKSILDARETEPRHYRLNANLMIPIVYRGGPVRNYIGELARLPGYKAARELWGTDAPSDCNRILVAVSETQGADYLGFWIPNWRRAGRELPGATRAYHSGEGTAVFRDDLPGLDGFDSKLAERWERYFQEGFREQMFVSLPVLQAGSTSVPTPAGVVNINIGGEEPWYRAYSPSWLGLASDVASQFATLALHAFGIELAATLTAEASAGALSLPVPEVPPPLCDLETRLRRALVEQPIAGLLAEPEEK